MKSFLKCICLLLAIVLVTVAFSGCGRKEEESSPISSNNATSDAGNAEDAVSLIGTWQGSDHDGENIVHYLIIDEKGYWNVYMNQATLVRAIRQLPKQLVSFKKFRELQNSDHTGCFYEYVESKSYADQFSIDEDGNLTAKFASDVVFSVSEKTYENVMAEAADIFENAQTVALSELNK